MRRPSLISLLILVSLTTASRAQTELRWKFTPAQRLSLSFHQRTETSATGAGKPTGIVIDMQVDVTWTVESVEGDTARIVQRFERLSTSMNTGNGKPIVYDSSEPNAATGPARDIAATVEKLIGAEFTVTMNTRGEIQDVEVPEAVETVLARSEGVHSLLTKEGLRDTLAKSMVVLPKDAIEPGSEWSTTEASKLPFGILHQETDYKYEGRAQRDGVAVERITAAGTLRIEAPKSDEKGRLNLVDQERSGNLWFDTDAGRFVGAEFKQEMTTERSYRDTVIKVVTKSSTTLAITPSEE